MRILFINSRPDNLKNPGGDTIQAQKTKAALESLGLVVKECSVQELGQTPPYDIAHVFNIQEPGPAWQALQILHSKGMPVVLSPIYWDMYAYWYELAVAERERWRKLARLLGKESLGRLYNAWQHLKAPARQHWQIQRRVLKHAWRILPNSEAETSLLQKSFSLNAGFRRKVDVIPNAIDSALYQPKPAPSDRFRKQYGIQNFVLEVGTINPVKNQLGLIEALYDLPIPIVFIGKVLDAYPEYGEQCQARGKERGNVFFINHVSHEELPGIYALAAVHALPSWRETPGLVSLEAAAAGCRVVTTSIGSTRDYFGNLAWYCYPNDLNSIRTAVEAALNSPPSPALRAQVLERFTWEKAAQATLAAYEKALDYQTAPA